MASAPAHAGLLPKHITFGLKGFGGSGVGRYAPGGLSDASINPDGTIHLIRNLHGLSTLELHLKKLDIYSYGGVEYAGRSYGFDPLAAKGAGANVGYGAPTFNNTGCYQRSRTRFRWFCPWHSGQLHGGHSCPDRGNHRLLVPLLQRTYEAGSSSVPSTRM